MSFRMSVMMSALSLWDRMASSECFWMDSSSLAGWPSLRTLALHRANLSTKLSTATLDEAQHRTCKKTQEPDESEMTMILSRLRCCNDKCSYQWQGHINMTKLISGDKIFTFTLINSTFCTFWPCLTACRMISTTVVVFPVPGGPWITASSLWAKAKDTASLWESSRFKLKNSTSSDET